MSDDFEDLFRRWLRERGSAEPSTIDALAAGVAALPARRRPWSGLAAAAAIVVALGLAAFVVAPRVGNVASPLSGPVPPDPAAFAGDPRLARCGATVATALDAFEMVHARDYRLYLPAIGLSPELDVDTAAFVVVYRGMQPFAVGGAAPQPGQTREPRSLAPGRHDVCVLVGSDAATAEPNVYSDVDISGLTVDVVPSIQSATPESTPGVAGPSFTPEPAPVWVADIAGQLDCNGPIANIGDEVPQVDGLEAFGETPEAALAVFLGPGNPYASLPTTGFEQLHAEAQWASLGHVVNGRVKAIVILTNTTPRAPGWSVVGLRACDASEFDPAIPLTFPVTIWTDATGQRVSTETLRSAAGPGHCGWESTIWLHLNGDLFFRDPKNVMTEWTTTKFDADADLPGTADDSGYRSDGTSLWLDPGKDAYLVSPGRVERLPRSSDPFLGCM